MNRAVHKPRVAAVHGGVDCRKHMATGLGDDKGEKTGWFMEVFDGGVWANAPGSCDAWATGCGA